MSNSSPGRALVIGGSLSGLFAGLLLRQAGWDVDVYERVAGKLSGRGAGIVVQPELIERLRAIGLDPIDLGVHVTTRKMFDATGRVVGTRECPQILTAWERVYRFLRNAFPEESYHRGKALETFVQTDRYVTAHFNDGSLAVADLLIGADGLRSTVRQQCVPNLMARYAGYVAWRGLVAENSLSPSTHSDLFPYMSFSLPPGEQLLGYPVAGPDNDLRPGFRRYNVVWYRPAEERSELAELLTDKTGVAHSISIPPPMIRHGAIVEMRAAAERLFGLQFREVVRLIDEPILQPIYDLETPRMAFGRVAIVGDAAFVARPHVAAGVAKAADDVASLVAALAAVKAVEPALRQFETERLPVNRRIIEQARHLGAYLQSEQTIEERARSHRHSIPEFVLAETAVLDFLH